MDTLKPHSFWVQFTLVELMWTSAQRFIERARVPV